MRNLKNVIVSAGLTLTPLYSVSAAEDADLLLFEEIIVTALKREKSLQEVPVAVSAISGKELLDRQVNDLIDLRLIAPNVNITSTSSASSTVISVRGIGTAGLNPGFESAVGTFIDGVYRSRAGHALADLFDIKRVEVLRGPQSTVFGKNTSAGVLQIITNAPEYVVSGGVKASVGNRNLVHSEGFVTGPISETIAYRLSGSFRQRDGVIDDVISGDDAYGDRDRWAVRGQLAFDPRDDLNFRLIADYRKFDEVGNVAPYEFVGPIGGLLALEPTLGGLGAFQPTQGVENLETRDVAVNSSPFDRVDDWGGALEANWQAEGFDLTSITAYRSNDSDRSIDPDHSNADILAPLAEREKYETFSQELRLSGSSDNINWLVGAYLFDEQLEGSGAILYASQTERYVSALVGGLFPGDDYSNFAPGSGVREVRRQDGDGWAIFTQNIWDIGNLSIIAGIRYSEESKKASLIVNDAPIDTFVNDTPCNTAFAQILLGIVCNNFSWEQKRNDEQVTGSFKLSYRLLTDIMIYASYDRGFKAGGFNLERQAVELVSDGVNPFPTVRKDAAQFDAEQPDAYEVGLKSQFLDKKIRLNVALFYTDYKDYQLLNFDGTSFTVDNLPEIISRGIETELFYKLMDGVSLNLGATYLDVFHGKDLVPSSVVFPGEQLQSTPRYQITTALNVDKNLSKDWRGLLNLGLYLEGDSEIRNPSLANVPITRDGYTVVNGAIGVASSDDRFKVMLWARNLTDEFYYTSIFPSVFQNGSNQGYVGEPRSYGLEFGYNF